MPQTRKKAGRTSASHLAEGGRRKPGTVRHYLNALSGLFRRAQEGLFVEPGYNPVAMMREKPTGRWKGEAREILEGWLGREGAPARLGTRDRSGLLFPCPARRDGAGPQEEPGRHRRAVRDGGVTPIRRDGSGRISAPSSRSTMDDKSGSA